jgi:hypothetical protein
MARNGIPDPRDYLLGRGELFFADSLDADGRPKNFRSLGHAEAFTVTVEAETLEHFSKRLASGVKDREVVLQQSVSFATQLTEIDVDNLALFMSGSAVDTVDAGGTLSPGAGDDNVIVEAAVGLGKWYDLFDNDAPSTYPPVAADAAERIYRVSNVVVKDTTATTTYVEGTDYDVDAEMGRIFIREGGSISAGDALLVSATWAALTISEVRALDASRIEGVLKFVSRNANQTGNGSEVEYTFHAVTLTADGDFALIGDEFATLNLNGACETNEIASPNSPTLTIRRLSA